MITNNLNHPTIHYGLSQAICPRPSQAVCQRPSQAICQRPSQAICPRPSCQLPELISMKRTEKILAIKTTNADSDLYQKCICTNCPSRQNMVAKKDLRNPHYRCVKKCCPLPYHWNMCQNCIESIHLRVKTDDPKRLSDAATFQRVFSKLPEDLQKCVAEYVPDVFEFARCSGRLLLDRKLGQNNKFILQLAGHMKQPPDIWNLVCKALHKIHYDEGLGIATKSNSAEIEICQRLKKLYQSLYEAHLGHVITDQDLWDSRGEVIRTFAKRLIVLGRIQQILRPATLHKYLVAQNR